MKIEKVAVIGAGMMGPGIAAVIALAGFDVTLIGKRPDRVEDGMKKAHAVMDQLLNSDLTTASAVARAKLAVRGTTDLDVAVQGVQLVIEAISENLELKQQLFQCLDRLTPPEVILATNTSGLSVTKISALATHRERIATTHFWMPAHLVPLVEVVMSIEQRVREAAEILGLNELLQRKPRELSGGQRQRVALGRAIVRKTGRFIRSEAPWSLPAAGESICGQFYRKSVHEFF